MGIAQTLGLPSIESENVIRKLWDKFSPMPGGRRLFGAAIGRMARYSGSIPFRVVTLREGHSEVILRDKPYVRNHLRSLHAIALINVAEIAGNLAAAYTMPDDARFIVGGISMDYLKKARGDVRAVATVPPITSSEKQEIEVTVDIIDRNDVVVAKSTLRTVIGPVKKK